MCSKVLKRLQVKTPRLSPSIPLLVVAASFLVPFAGEAQNITLRSIAKMGGIGNQVALGIGASLDSATNVYVLGQFDTAVSVGSSQLNHSASYPGIFLAKLSFLSSSVTAPPVEQWAVAPTMDAALENPKFAVRQTGGSSFLAASFSGTNVSFGDRTITNVAPGLSSDILLGQYDNQGNPVWLTSFGGQGNDTSRDLALHSSGVSYVVGSFDSATFTAGANILTRQNPTGVDSFVIKVQNDGSVSWARGGSYAAATSVAVDESQNVYVAGATSGAASFDGMTPTNQVDNQFFIKYNASGSPVWCRGDMKTGKKMAVDRSGNIVSVGNFSGTVQLGSQVLSNNAISSVYIVKYDATGNAVWANALVGLGHDDVSGLMVDVQTNYWVTGSFASADEGGVRVNPKAFLACFKQNGSLLGLRLDEGSGTSMGAGFGTFMGMLNFVCGTFTNNMSVPPHSLTNSSDHDIFLTRISPAPPSLQTVVQGNTIINSWPSHTSIGYAQSEAFTFQVSGDLSQWNNATNAASLSGGRYVITNSLSESVKFFRLKR